jgi:hypothetical protein
MSICASQVSKYSLPALLALLMCACASPQSSDLRVGTPSFSPPPGTYSSFQTVTISSQTPGSTIRYTVDGTEPAASAGTIYTTPITLGPKDVLKAIAYKNGLPDSPVKTGSYPLWKTLGGPVSDAGPQQFNYPDGIALDGNGGIYVVEYFNHRLVHMNDMDGSGWATLGGNGPSGYGSGINQFHGPSAVALDSDGRVYVADCLNGRIVRVDDITGAGWTTFGSVGTGTNQFDEPIGIAVDGQGHIYVLDSGNNRVVRVDDMAGTNWTSFGSLGFALSPGEFQFSPAAGFSGANKLAIDGLGHVLVTDQAWYRVDQFDDDLSGSGWVTYNNTRPNVGPFAHLTSIGVGGDGRIYVMDGQVLTRFDDMTGANLIQVGSQGTAEFQFQGPSYGIAVDSHGVIFLADPNANRIAMFTMP